MSSIKTKRKELVFECDSAQEALQLLQTYRKKNFHLVSRKIINPDTATVALKLIKFRQSSHGADLETVWERFVNQLTAQGIENSFIAEILIRIRSKPRFWEVHPEDHLHDILMDARNFVKFDQLAKVFVFVAPEAELMSFFCAYQKSIAAMIKSMGIFVMCPERLKSVFKDLRVSPHVQTIPYNGKSKLSVYQKDIDSKIGVILATPEDLNLFSENILEQNIFNEKVSLIVSPKIESTEILNVSAPKYLAGSYTHKNPSSETFATLNFSLKHQIPVAFLWNEESVSSILNPEAQLLRILDEFLENQNSQHLHHE